MNSLVSASNSRGGPLGLFAAASPAASRSTPAAAARAAGLLPAAAVYALALALVVALAVVYRDSLVHYASRAHALVAAALQGKPFTGGGEAPALTLLPEAAHVPSAGADTPSVDGTHALAAAAAHAAASGPEVFHVGRSVYTFADAPAVCRAFGAELATYAQVREAWERGADWCSYGWVKGQAAVFPTQAASWEALQRGPAESRGACGKPGVNGGFFDNPELRFGVNCYGPPPARRGADLTGEGAGAVALPMSAEQVEFEKRVQRFRDQMDGMPVAPWAAH